jgi:hypothetical protein
MKEIWKLLELLNEYEIEKEKSELEWRKYWKNKAEKLQKENLMLKQRIMYLELALNIWSEWHSELIVGQNEKRDLLWNVLVS